MSQFDIKMTELADAIKSKNTSVSGKLSVQEMINAVRGITAGSGDAGSGGGVISGNVKFGYWTEDGKFQEIDLSGESPQDTGNPIAADVVTFETGKPAPDYNSGYVDTGDGTGETQFYFCTGYDGVVEKIIITAGTIVDEMDEPVSLVGEYTIVDPAAVGTARKWYCPKTTASGDYPAYNYGVTIGCVEIDTGNWDENDNLIYEKYWAIAPGKYIDEWSYWLSSQTEGLESPFLVQDWRGYGGTIVTAPVLTSDVADAAPYGPTGWSGIPIVKTDKPVFVSYGAGAKSANGFWEQIAGDGLSIHSRWQLIGTDSIIEDGNSNDNSPGSYHFWILRGNYQGEYQQLYDEAGDSWMAENIKHPGLHAWESGSSSYSPPPTFLYSKTGGYFPEGEKKSNIPFYDKLPEIGGFYNSGATIKVEVFIPEHLYDPDEDKEATE